MIELVLRIGFSLLVVFGLMWVLAKLARRPLAGRSGTAVTVLARQQLSRSASVAVVQVADRALVLGVTDGQVSLLGEADPAALHRPAPSAQSRLALPLPDSAALPSSLPPESRDAGPLAAPPPAPPSRLAGSILSPSTWRQTVEFLRERTARR